MEQLLDNLLVEEFEDVFTPITPEEREKRKRDYYVKINKFDSDFNFIEEMKPAKVRGFSYFTAFASSLLSIGLEWGKNVFSYRDIEDDKRMSSLFRRNKIYALQNYSNDAGIYWIRNHEGVYFAFHVFHYVNGKLPFEHRVIREEFEDIFKPASPEEVDKRVMDYIESICTKNSDGEYSCQKDIILSARGLKKLPVKFLFVDGDFDCSSNELITLEGAPVYVGHHFDCSFNKLTSLKGGPKTVWGDYSCVYNRLTTLEGQPEYIGGNFFFGENAADFQTLGRTRR